MFTIDLNNITSCSIRGKHQQWSGIGWLGLISSPELTLVAKSTSVKVNLNDGSVSKHYPLIDRLVGESKWTGISRNGHYLMGLKRAGDVFVWDAVNRHVYSITGLPELKNKDDNLRLYVTEGLKKLVVCRNLNTFHVWIRSNERLAKLRHPPKQNDLEGTWYDLIPPPDTELPDISHEEADIDICLYNQNMMISTSFVDKSGALKLVTANMSTEPSIYIQRVTPHIEWYDQSLAGSQDFPISRTEDLLLVRYAPTTAICAVAINQLSFKNRCLMFVSPEHYCLTTSNLKSLRESPTCGRSPLWIADMKWTPNSLLLIVLMQSGCVAVISRLGNPLSITTRDMSISLQSDYLLSLLPRNINSTKMSRGFSRSMSLSSAVERHVMISMHPSLMRFILSDGLNVLVFELPNDITCRSLSLAMLSEAKMADQPLDLILSGSQLNDSVQQDGITTKSLNLVIRVWCLLISSDIWSNQLKDVSNEVAAVMSRHVLTAIDYGDIQQSARRVLRSVIGIMALIILDSKTQHMLPAFVKFIGLIVKGLLYPPDMDISSRLCLAELAFLVVKVAEKIIDRTYTLLPTSSSSLLKDDGKRNVTSYEVVSSTTYPVQVGLPLELQPNSAIEPEEHDMDSLSVRTQPSCLPSRSLSTLYTRIYRSVCQIYSARDEDVDSVKINRVLESVVSSLTVSPDKRSSSLWIHTDLLYLEGHHLTALKELVTQYADVSSMPAISSILHSIIYTKLRSGSLLDVLQFIEGIIADNLNLHHLNTDKDYLNIHSLPPHSTVKALVRTLARFMARYFMNGDLFVFPPHNPIPLPPLYATNIHDLCAVPLDRKLISQSVSRLLYPDAWSVQATTRYLLISGLMSELVYFSRQMGDHNTAFSVSALLTEHHKSLKHLKRYDIHSILPTELSASSIHNSLFEQFSNDSTESSDSIQYIMMPAALFGLHTLSSHMSSLWQRMKQAASKLSCLVPNDLYLPAPALYCPQLDIGDQELTPELKLEINMRMELSSLVLSMLRLLSGTNADLPCCGWLLRKLSEAWKKSEKGFKKLPMISKTLEQFKTYHILETDKHNKLVLAVFRNLCSLLWMLHIRDKLSMMLRKSTALLQSHVAVSDQVGNEGGLQTRYKHLEKTLTWCLRYLPFSRFLNSVNDLCEIVISVCEDLPPSAKLAKTLSQGITDIEALAPEVKDRMEHLLQSWQTVDIDPRKTMSLSIYYFECCNRVERQEDADFIEKDIFMSTKGHRVVGSRKFEYDKAYVNFLELFFDVSFQSSLPSTGVAKPPALVPTNRKSFELMYFNKQPVKFQQEEMNLEDTLNQHKNAETDGMSTLISDYRPESPGKSGMFRKKRWATSEEEMMKKMKKLGVSQSTLNLENNDDNDGTVRLSKTSHRDILSSPVSLKMLTQSVKLPERYQKLSVKYQWLLCWSERQIFRPTHNQAVSHVSVELQWLILALIMVEKGLYTHSKHIEALALPPKPEERAQVKSDLPYNDNNNAQANASLFALEPESEQEDRDEVILEMERQSRLSTATLPINERTPSIPPIELTTTEYEKTGDINSRGDDGVSTASFIFDDTATTIWSSATLPNLSGSSHVTTAPHRESADLDKQQLSSYKTQESVSTGSRPRSRKKTRKEVRPGRPTAESTKYDLESESETAVESEVDQAFRLNSQIPLLHVPKDGHLLPAKQHSYKDVKLGRRERRKMEFLQVYDIHNSMLEQNKPVGVPESVKLPLLSMRPSKMDDPSVRTPLKELWENRVEKARWNNSIPLLKAPDRIRCDNTPDAFPPQPPTSHVAAAPRLAAADSDPSSLAFGPALLSDYDRANREKNELLTRMIRQMKDKSLTAVDNDGHLTHPKYSLLKLKLPAEPEIPQSADRIDRSPKDDNDRAQVKSVRKQQRRSQQKFDKKHLRKAPVQPDVELATVSEKTEKSYSPGKPTTTDTSVLTEDVVTKDSAVQHSPVDTEQQLTDYSYLFSLAASRGEGEEEIKLSDLDAASLGDDFAAVQYRAMRLQQEENKIKMVDASVMTTPTRTIILRHEPKLTRDAPALAPNIIEDLKYNAVTAAGLLDKENAEPHGSRYLGVVDITPSDKQFEQEIHQSEVQTTPIDKELLAVDYTPDTQPRSEKILQEIRQNKLEMDIPGKLNFTRMGISELSTHNKPDDVAGFEAKPVYIIPKPGRFVSAEIKNTGKLGIRQDLANMDDRLDYIAELREKMIQEIQSTEMVLPRYHLSYQQRQVQTRLSIPADEDFATILENADNSPKSLQQRKSSPHPSPKRVRMQGDTAQHVPTDQMSTARASEGHQTDRTARMLVGKSTKASPVMSGLSLVDGNTDFSLDDGNTEDLVKQAERLLDDDTLPDVSLNISTEVNDLGRLSTESLMIANGAMRLAAIGDRRSAADKEKEKAEQKRLGLKEWQKKHQAEVREKYRKELEKSRKPETRPFNSGKQVTTSDLKKTSVVSKRRRQEMVVENHLRRQEQAKIIYDEIKAENEELNLNMDNIYDVTVQVPVKKASKKEKTTSARKHPIPKSSTIRRGRATIQAPGAAKPNSAPAGFRTVYPRFEKEPTVETGYGFTPRYVFASGTFDDVDDDGIENEPPMEDESYLLVPKYKGGQDEADRVRQLLYSDQSLGRVDSEINLSNISDLVTESELSAESYLDWDVIDEMVAILSTHSS